MFYQADDCAVRSLGNVHLIHQGKHKWYASSAVVQAPIEDRNVRSKNTLIDDLDKHAVVKVAAANFNLVVGPPRRPVLDGVAASLSDGYFEVIAILVGKCMLRTDLLQETANIRKLAAVAANSERLTLTRGEIPWLRHATSQVSSRFSGWPHVARHLVPLTRLRHPRGAACLHK